MREQALCPGVGEGDPEVPQRRSLRKPLTNCWKWNRSAWLKKRLGEKKLQEKKKKNPRE